MAPTTSPSRVRARTCRSGRTSSESRSRPATSSSSSGHTPTAWRSWAAPIHSTARRAASASPTARAASVGRSRASGPTRESQVSAEYAATCWPCTIAQPATNTAAATRRPGPVAVCPSPPAPRPGRPRRPQRPRRPRRGGSAERGRRPPAGAQRQHPQDLEGGVRRVRHARPDLPHRGGRGRLHGVRGDHPGGGVLHRPAAPTGRSSPRPSADHHERHRAPARCLAAARRGSRYHLRACTARERLPAGQIPRASPHHGSARGESLADLCPATNITGLHEAGGLEEHTLSVPRALEEHVGAHGGEGQRQDTVVQVRGPTSRPSPSPRSRAPRPRSAPPGAGAPAAQGRRCRSRRHRGTGAAAGRPGFSLDRDVRANPVGRGRRARARTVRRPARPGGEPHDHHAARSPFGHAPPHPDRASAHRRAAGRSGPLPRRRHDVRPARLGRRGRRWSCTCSGRSPTASSCSASPRGCRPSRA